MESFEGGHRKKQAKGAEITNKLSSCSLDYPTNYVCHQLVTSRARCGVRASLNGTCFADGAKGYTSASVRDEWT